MPIVAEKPKSSITQLEAGTYQAVCYGVWDIGKQKINWNGQEKIQHKIVISWELDKRIKDEGDYKDKRYVLSKRYTLSMNDRSNLSKDLTSWFGKKPNYDFDLEKLRGWNCVLTVVNVEKDNNVYSNISSVGQCMKGMEQMKPELDNAPPEWVVDLQKNALTSSSQAAAPSNDSIPF